MNKIALKYVFAVVLLCLPAVARAQGAPSVAVISSEADRDFAVFMKLLTSQPPTELKTAGAQAMYRWADASMQKLIAEGLDFYKKYPTDVRRWEIVKALSTIDPPFVKNYGAKFETMGLKDAVIDEAAKGTWRADLAKLKKAMSMATDLPLTTREEEDYSLIENDFLADAAAKQAGRHIDWTVYRTFFDAHVAKYASLGKVMVARADDYLGGLNQFTAGGALAEWAHIQATSPCAMLRAHAAAKIKFLEHLKLPFELNFIALDGWAVDFALLRGKVVLVDFWATWSRPSVAELSIIKKAYEAYHDQGLEVVGIALEDANLAAFDSDAQKGTKLAQARAELSRFIAANAIPWPQYFDGQRQNAITASYQVSSVPTTFLLDQEGKIAFTNPRGPELEARIKQLLKLR